jgi:uncharacterized protein involved in type VI secretion and phage assembly
MNEQLLLEIVERLRNRFYGKYRGTVTEVNKDGRIKALVPGVLGDQATGWCMPCVPYAGQDRGVVFLPEKDAGVWIEFEGGDVSFPIWTGCYWHRDEMPDRVDVDVKVIKTDGKQLIVLDDKNHTIELTDSNDNHVTLDRSGVTTVRKNGKLAVTEDKVTAMDGGMEVT